MSENVVLQLEVTVMMSIPKGLHFVSKAQTPLYIISHYLVWEAEFRFGSLLAHPQRTIHAWQQLDPGGRQSHAPLHKIELP